MADIELLGMDQLLAQLSQLGVHGEKIGKDAVKSGAEIVKESMEDVNRSNKKQPHIQDNIEVKISKVDGEYTAKILPNKEVAWRAHFLEFGTSKMSAKPFIEKSLTDNKSKVNNAMMDTIRDGLGL
ncbi:HK97 gp10 family phage protein [Bacillus cytotoxicus]|uniref:HK97 gp10 family phage protein n=1 Tax=Bacillus cytotoxicus TaxID=580165 RepID=A0ACC6A7L3_9BACI|nr:HK97 gp10 family phage protein [Bacillus cytotoxicus]